MLRPKIDTVSKILLCCRQIRWSDVALLEGDRQPQHRFCLGFQSEFLALKVFQGER